MTKVLITGATGNVGVMVFKALQKYKHDLELFAGVRNTETVNEKILNHNLKSVNFDFTNFKTFLPALENIDILFLLRPPQISDVNSCFKPLILAAKQARIKQIIFLSVQGVEKSKIIPHHKIEKIIIDSKIAFTFLRPAYFMQNFTTTLHQELVKNQRIYLPAGKAKFTIIDTEDIGLVVAKVLTEPEKHISKKYDLTNSETLSFGEMAKKLSLGLDKEIKFISPNLFQFFITKRREGIPTAFIFVMIMLHYLPRFQKTPKTTKWVKKITGNEAKLFDDFVLENREELV